MQLSLEHAKMENIDQVVPIDLFATIQVYLVRRGNFFTQNIRNVIFSAFTLLYMYGLLIWADNHERYLEIS